MHETTLNETLAPHNDEPAVPVAERVRPVPRLHYLYSYSFVFQNPQWISNLVCVAIAPLVPVLGRIVQAGYQYEIVEGLHRRPGEPYPDFDTGRLSDYLNRGIWAYLVQLFTQLVVFPINFVVAYGAMILIVVIGAVAGPENQGAATAIAAMFLVPLALVVILGIPLLIRFFTMPLILRASLTQDAGELFNLRFMQDFVRRTWREMLLEETWLMVTTPIVIVCGYLCCLVGVIPAAAMVALADAQTNWQLYEIYLARGGEEIRPKSRKPGKVVYESERLRPAGPTGNSPDREVRESDDT